MLYRLLALLALAAGVASCNYDPRPGPAVRAAAAEAARQRHGIWVSPSEIVDCGATVGTSGDVRWNFSNRRGLATVRVDVREGNDGAPKAFTGGGPTGSIATGPWLRPHVQFIAVDTQAGTVLGVAEVGAYPCG